jgi:hypothetical protein
MGADMAKAGEWEILESDPADAQHTALLLPGGCVPRCSTGT